MRILIVSLGLAIFLLPYTNAFAASQNDDPKHGKVILDQSKDVVFEQYGTNTFALDLIKDRNKFDMKSLVIGGMGEFDFQHWQGDRIELTPPSIYHNGTGFYFTQFSIDAMVNVTKWSTVFISGTDSHIGQGGPDGNYKYLQHDFVLLGNLDKSPVYLVMGINTVPFGVFPGSGTWDIPLTSDYFNVQQAPQISLAFFKNDWNLNTTFYSDQTNHENHWTYNISYSKFTDCWSYGAGAGYLTNLKTNTTGNPSVNAVRKSTAGLDMGNVWDVNANVGYKIIALTGEYNVGSQRVGVNKSDPSAYGLTLSIAPKIADVETTFGISHSKTFNLKDIPTTLLGLDGVPLTTSGLKDAWGVSVSRPIYKKYLTLGLDAARSETYSNKQTYTYTLDFIGYL